MQTRRTFIGQAAAIIAGLVAAAAKAGRFKTHIYTSEGWKETHGRRAPIDVTGKPTPVELIKGVPGVTYFNAASSHPATRGDYANGLGMHWHLDGVPIDCRSGEIDIVGGWARMFNVTSGPDEKGMYVLASRNDEYEEWAKKWTHPSELTSAYVNNSGKLVTPWGVPKISAPLPPAPFEFIHFGHVELR